MQVKYLFHVLHNNVFLEKNAEVDLSILESIQQKVYFVSSHLFHFRYTPHRFKYTRT